MTDQLYAVVNLSSQDETFRFMRAAGQIENTVADTIVRIYNMAECAPGCACGKGDGPPHDPNLWRPVGVIAGPEIASDATAPDKAAFLASWTREVGEILEKNGLVEEKLVIN